MTTEAMGFKDTLRYGVNACAERAREGAGFLNTQAALSRTALQAPSALAETPSIPPSMWRAAERLTATLIEREGFELTDQQREQAARDASLKAERARFDASRWAFLFPTLRLQPEVVVRL